MALRSIVGVKQENSDMKKMPNFQPLRIPELWNVEYNTFIDTDPKEMENMSPLERALRFTESLLQMSFERDNLVLDLGWYPEGDPQGKYRLLLLRGIDWENPLVSYNTSLKEDVVQKIEEILWKAVIGEFKEKNNKKIK